MSVSDIAQNVGEIALSAASLLAALRQVLHHTRFTRVRFR